MDKQGYNGYANYETWATALWIDNDESIYGMCRETVREAIAETNTNPFMNEERAALSRVAAALESFVENVMLADILPTGLAADLLNGTFRTIDFYDLAKHYIDEINED